jgi:hypothetical protein
VPNVYVRGTFRADHLENHLKVDGGKIERLIAAGISSLHIPPKITWSEKFWVSKILACGDSGAAAGALFGSLAGTTAAIELA